MSAADDLWTVIGTRNIWNVRQDFFSCFRLVNACPQVQLFFVGLVSASIYLMHVIVFDLQEITLDKRRKLSSNSFVKQLL